MQLGWFMNAAPLIGRELRAEAQRPLNYWLRILAAGAVILVFTSVMITSRAGPSQLGSVLFLALHQALFFTFWIVVPLMTADCISREKREGTLGLLFLTPLRVGDVIAAKGAIHALRALTLFLAAAPVLVLPFVIGGVGLPLIAYALLHEVNAVLLGIAAGLYASARGGSTVQVMVQAEGCALGLALLSLIWSGTFGSSGLWRMFGFMGYIGINLGFCWVLVLAILRASRRRLHRTWHQDSAAPEQPAWVKIFSGSGFWQAVFQWNRGQTLDRNPMAWLQEYSWTARLTKWGWCVLLLATELVILCDWNYRHLRSFQSMLVMALALAVAFSATNSFRRERQTGLLEVLLVTPLSVRQLIGGRLWGIFCHYFPALSILTVCWIGYRLLETHSYPTDLLTLMVPNPMAFVALMLLGLFMSLSRLSFLLVWGLTWVIAFLLPATVPLVLVNFYRLHISSAIWVSTTLEIGIAVVAWFLLERNIHQRAFLEDQKA